MRSVTSLHTTTFALALVLFGVLAAQAQGPSYRAPVQPPTPAPQSAEPAPRFPNKDTAKNRQDYEMTTSGGEAIVMGKDSQTGEEVMIHVPPKKNQSAPGLDQPLDTRPIIPLIWKDGKAK